jgi:hypothetical protein
MPTDTAVLERALVVMAIAISLQTLLFMGAAVAAFMAWRRASAALVEARMKAEAQVAELRVYLDRLSVTVDETARALRRGTSTADDLMRDVRDAMGTVGNSMGTVASVVSAPRTALAVGLWKGIQFWRKRRAAQRLEGAATSQL